MAEADFYYKGLMEEARFFPYTPDQSVKLAKSSWYKVWFDVLKVSPWYKEMEEGKSPKSEAARKTYELFGDLQRISFDRWWSTRGYEIFAEKVRYQDTVAHEITTKQTLKIIRDKDEPPKLVLEIPLNVDPEKLKEDIDSILQRHSECYYAMKNRWLNATAEARLDHDSKIDMTMVYVWLDVYKEVAEGKFTQAEICRELNLKPSLFEDFPEGTALDEFVKRDAIAVTNEYFKKARKLMAHATEGRFPCVDRHEWRFEVKDSKRKK